MHTESELLAHIYARSARLAAKHPCVIVGPGDDCAVLRADPGFVGGLGAAGSSSSLLLITVDQLVEHRHFTRGTPIERIARKAVARSVSDIAAMGGSPVWSLATGVLPHRFDAADKLFDSMRTWAERFGCPLVGGDIATHAPPELSLKAGGCDINIDPPLVLTVTVAGVPHPSRGPVLRSSARPGDSVCITGRVGGSLGSGHHLTFEPRVREGLWLAETLGEHLHAMIDISDGVGRDAGRIAAASNVRVRIDLHLLPLSPGVSASEGIGGGEDYELLFTVASGAEVPGQCPHTGTPITRIGVVEQGSGCVAVDAGGREREVSDSGWDH